MIQRWRLWLSWLVRSGQSFAGLLGGAAVGSGLGAVSGVAVDSGLGAVSGAAVDAGLGAVSDAAVRGKQV